MKLTVWGLGLLLGLQMQAFALNSSPFVIDGEKVQPEEALSGVVVKVRMPMGECTGTLVSANVVVTAAHCPDMGGSSYIEVAHLPTGRSTSVETIEMAPNATLDTARGHHLPDITVFKLKEPLFDVPTTLSIATPGPGVQVRASGYGVGTAPGNLPDRLAVEVSEPSKILSDLYGDLDPNNEETKKYLDGLNYLLNEMAQYYVIAQPVKAGQSMCFGDSGGPTYVDHDGYTELVGVNGAIFPHPNKGADRCKYGFLQMFTPIAPYASWIQQRIQDWK